MTEQFVVSYGPQRARERGIEKFRFDYRNIKVTPGEKLEIPAYNQLWFVIEAGHGITVSSDYGDYDPDNPLWQENTEEHGDRMIIENTGISMSQVKFIIIAPAR